MTTRVASGKKRGRVAWSASATRSGADDSDDSDSADSGSQRISSRPKKRFIWPEVYNAVKSKTDHVYACEHSVC